MSSGGSEAKDGLGAKSDMPAGYLSAGQQLDGVSVADVQCKLSLDNRSMMRSGRKMRERGADSSNLFARQGPGPSELCS